MSLSTEENPEMFVFPVIECKFFTEEFPIGPAIHDNENDFITLPCPYPTGGAGYIDVPLSSLVTPIKTKDGTPLFTKDGKQVCKLDLYEKSLDSSDFASIQNQTEVRNASNACKGQFLEN